MNAPRAVPDWVRDAQLKATDPDVSAWVSANAGSGKTHVLTQRVINLLLKGEDPARILCITFTRAAAATMATRVFDTLARWTTLDNRDLDISLVAIGRTPTPDLRARARRLFALALETPGGLKVQTIHAFCTRLLHQFPFEADVAAGFSVLDEATESQLLEKLSLDVMLEGAADPDKPLGRALAIAIAHAADQTLRDVLREAVIDRDSVTQWVERAGSVDAAIAHLSQALNVGADDTSEGIDEELLSAAQIAEAEWPALAQALAEGQKSDRGQQEQLVLASRSIGRDRLSAYLSIFCTDARQKRERIVTNAFRNKHPQWADRLDREQARICALLDKQRAVSCRDRTGALLTIAQEIIARYQAEKNRRGLLDYDDLIDRTLELFRKTSAAWVLYKLDLGINHVLLDEAQDTSPKQWEIIRTLAGEFTAGAGARPVRRTLFAVGDDKQSIFSFQGADPTRFAEMAKAFEKDFRQAELAWELVKLQASFRSGKVILDAVDCVFRRPEAHAGFASDPAGTAHEALPDAAPGNVEIWPLVVADDKRDIEGWDAPFDATSETSPQIRLARKIARHVALWQKAGARPGEILILVRQRGALFEAIIRALKQERIAVAGADRLVLTDHIAVMDLIALADALLLPQDDLALATVLKSPLFGFSEEDLYAIAWNRGGASLRSALLARAADHPIVAEAALTIERLTDAARRESPFTFYADLLGAHGGRRKILARLGPEANDAIDEFLNLALTYEGRETPSLQGFVAWLHAARAEIKRDMEIARDEVRVMTVHGAKGLEAPTVILADTTTRPAGFYPPRLIDFPIDGAHGFVWVKAKDTDAPAVVPAREISARLIDDEYRRLLYVAITRAKERLVVCGIAGKLRKDGTPPMPPNCWYELIEDALRPQSTEIDAEDGEGKIWRYLSSAPAFRAPAEQIALSDAAPTAWLKAEAPGEPAGAITIFPSLADDEEWTASAVPATDRATALLRGRLTHRLMQSLPEIAPERRANAARTYLARAGASLSESERNVIASQVVRILNDLLFAPLFAPGSRAEVPIVGYLPRDGHASLAVSGQVDRLAVTPETVLIADYKTNRPAPRDLDEAIARHPGYIRQLALYRAVLRRIYPAHAVRAALIWTETPDLMEIPAHALDAALAPLTST